MDVFWRFVTDFGDSAVTLPLVIFFSIYFVLLRRPKTVVAWVLATGGCGLIIALLKIFLRSCTQRAADGAGILSPSGHTAMSVAVYGSLAALAGLQISTRPRYFLAVFTTISVAAIALSRVALDAHTIGEVALGFLVGSLAVTGFWFSVRREPPMTLQLRWLATGVIGVIIVTHGMQWPIEETLRTVATMLRGNLPGCG